MVPTVAAKKPAPHHRDQDEHKGALEGYRPTDEQHSNPHGECIDDEGMPCDEVAVFEDAEGALEDETQG